MAWSLLWSKQRSLHLIDPTAVVLNPLTEFVQVSLQTLPTLKKTNTSYKLRVICKFTEDVLKSHVQIINKDIERDWAQNWALKITVATGHQLDFAPFTTTLWAWPFSQVVLIEESTYPYHKQWVSSEECCRGLCQILFWSPDRQHPSPALIHQALHLVVQGDQVGKEGPALHKSMLAGLDVLIVLHVLCNGTHDHVLHNLAWNQGQSDRTAVLGIILPILVDGCYTCQFPVFWNFSS